MNKLIKDYAKEGKDKDGRPNGRFFLDQTSLKKVSKPYVNKYYQWKPNEDKKLFWQMNFGELWHKYDVLDEGFVEVERIGTFIKELVHDYTIDI